MGKGEKKVKWGMIYYLSLIGFFAIFSTTISKSPVLPLYVKALGGDNFIIGLISAFSPLAGILFSFPIGIMSDRIGRKKLLISSAFIFLIAPLLYLSVHSAMWLIPVRFFHGMATAILGPIASAMIVGSYKKDKGEKLGIYSSSTLIGRTIAPLLGGFIISYFANLSGLMSYRYVYITAFLMAIPVFVLTLMLKDKQNVNSKIRTGIFYVDLKYFIGNKRVFSTALVQMATYFAFGAFETYLPVYLSLRNIPPYQIGLIFSVQILFIALSQPLFGRIADRVDKRLQIMFGVLVLGAAIGLIGFFTSIVSAIVLGIIFGLGLSFSTVATSTYIAEVTEKSKLGASLGGLSSIMDVGQTIGPFLTGIIITYLSFSVGFEISFLVAAISAAIFYFANRGK